MTPIRDFFTRLFKKKPDPNAPWLEYYSRKERSIKFTKKSIYHYLVDEVGEDKDKDQTGKNHQEEDFTLSLLRGDRPCGLCAF